MSDNEPRIDVGVGSYLTIRAEREALSRALEWVKHDPFFGDTEPTDREVALMRLALRALTAPTLFVVAMQKLPFSGKDES